MRLDVSGKMIAFPAGNKQIKEQAAELLYKGFQEIWPFMVPDVQAARKIVHGTQGLGKPDINIARRLA